MKEQCIYQNKNAGHRIRVRVLEQVLPRMWRVVVIENGSQFPKDRKLTVPEQDLIEA